MVLLLCFFVRFEEMIAESASPINSKILNCLVQLDMNGAANHVDFLIVCVFRFMGVEQDVAVPGRRGASAALQYVTGWDPGKANRRWKRHPVLSKSGAHHCPSQRGTCIYSVLRIWATCLPSIVICVCCGTVYKLIWLLSVAYIVQVILRLF